MVPGWSEAERKYHPLDCERWIRKNGIRSRSRLMVFGPWGLVATLLEPKGRRARLPPGT